MLIQRLDIGSTIIKTIKILAINDEISDGKKGEVLTKIIKLRGESLSCNNDNIYEIWIEYNAKMRITNDFVEGKVIYVVGKLVLDNKLEDDCLSYHIHVNYIANNLDEFENILAGCISEHINIGCMSAEAKGEKSNRIHTNSIYQISNESNEPTIPIEQTTIESETTKDESQTTNEDSPKEEKITIDNKEIAIKTDHWESANEWSK